MSIEVWCQFMSNTAFKNCCDLLRDTNMKQNKLIIQKKKKKLATNQELNQVPIIYQY